MEKTITKLDENTLEISEIVKTKIIKEDLESEKEGLSNRLVEIDEMLKKFDEIS